MNRLERAAGAATSGAGRALAAVFYLVGRARPGQQKSLHPRGAVVRGRVVRHGGAPTSGVVWLDRPGVDDVLVRLSRAAGLPAGWPDIHGLAIRVPHEQGYGDLLLATTGAGPLTRFLLEPARRPDSASYTTLLPYRTSGGPLLIAAFPRSGGGTYDLAWAASTGDWQGFARLEVGEQVHEADDGPVTFDPVLAVLPGLETYDWVVRLRELSYAASRQARGQHDAAVLAAPRIPARAGATTGADKGAVRRAAEGG